jgi:nicotinamide-nucleotide amidase
VWGLGESAVEERIQPLLHSTNPTIATYAKNDAVDVRITAKGETREEAERKVEEMEAQARQILRHHVFGVDKDTLQGVVGKYLTERGQWLAVMESLTGGLLSIVNTDSPGSSKYFVGGMVSYSPDLKVQMGVPREVIDRYGVISEQTARAMAHTVREQLHADYGLGITGVAGPDKQEDKPVGTVHIAIEGPDGVVTGMGPGWRASREDTKRLSVLAALNLLRLHLEGVKRGE